MPNHSTPCANAGESDGDAVNVFALMLLVAACYTFTSLSDKSAITEAKLSGNMFTFLMCASMSVFLAVSLPFQEIYFLLSWQAFAGILFVSLCKILEFQMSALVLRKLSAFELKAWLGVTLFASYITDVCYGTPLRFLKLACITVTVCGLVLVARSGRGRQIKYRKILLPLVLYLAAKYGYGLVIKAFTPYASSAMLLLPAFVLIAIILLPTVTIAQLRANHSGIQKVVLARIPNTVGILAENAVISVSLTSYSFIQPMVLVGLFFIRLLRKECCSVPNLFGSILCILGLLAFQSLG